MNTEELLVLKSKLINLFKDLVFDEPTHTYKVEKESITSPLISCTTLNKKFDNFDKDKISKEKADKLGVSQESLLKEWDNIGKIATEKGTLLHYINECIMLNDDRASSLLSESMYKDVILDFHKWFNDNYTPVLVEFRVYDVELGIAGTMDLLCYNKNTNQLCIMDYKTGKDIVKVETYKCKYTKKMKESKFKLGEPFSHLPKSNFYKYSIQLSEYREILKRNADLEINELVLVHFSEDKFKPFNAEIISLDELWKI